MFLKTVGMAGASSWSGKGWHISGPWAAVELHQAKQARLEATARGKIGHLVPLEALARKEQKGEERRWKVAIREKRSRASSRTIKTGSDCADI